MIGKTLGHYQITDKLGEGGMGLVYKARDLHLDRFVALKILPPEKVADPERKRRFVQEAKAASALNHPNIIHVYDIDQSEGTDFIAMEYVDGKTLDELTTRKGMRLGDTLKCAVQIADALAAAHSAGIVHRDLKPANVMVTDKGLVKVLDFGLAKLTEPVESDEFMTTETVQPRTEEGAIVGTVAYMSPEQAEGKKVDARSDIFSLGSVLYEMVTGQKAFQGTSKMSTLAAILHQDPKPVSGITPMIPADLEKLINRCLRKDPAKRWQTMADVKVALDEIKEESGSSGLETPGAAKHKPRHRLIWPLGLAAALLVVLGVAGVGWWFLRCTGTPPETSLVPAPLTSYPGSERDPSFSPDGNQVAFAWNGENQDNWDIYVKLIGAESRLGLTSSPAEDRQPAWSPDGRYIAFLRYLPEGKAAVMLIPAIGGPERKLTEILPAGWQRGSGLAWSSDGNWLAMAVRASSAEPSALFLRSIESGEQRRLTSPSANLLAGDSDPVFSPDGRTLVFSRAQDQNQGDLYFLALSSDLKPVGELKRLTFDNQSNATPAWTADGREIVYSSSAPGGSRSLWRVAVSGSRKPQPLVGVDGNQPAISRNGRRLVFTRSVRDVNIWRLELPGPRDNVPPQRPASTPFMSSTREDNYPQFSPDGKRVAFVSARTGHQEIYVCDSDGSNIVPLTSLGGPMVTTPRWSPDGERIAFDADLTEGQWDIYTISASGGKPQRLTSDPANDGNPSWSHDGRWIYFDSARTGRAEAYRVPVNGGEAIQLTRKGAFGPMESPDGKVLYFTKSLVNTSLWRVPVEGGEEIKVLNSVRSYNSVALVPAGIYFVPGAGGSIQFFDVGTGNVTQIATIGPHGEGGLTISPDGRTILHMQVDQSGSDLMLVENFR